MVTVTPNFEFCLDSSVEFLGQPNDKCDMIIKDRRQEEVDGVAEGGRMITEKRYQQLFPIMRCNKEAFQVIAVEIMYISERHHQQLVAWAMDRILRVLPQRPIMAAWKDLLVRFPNDLELSYPLHHLFVPVHMTASLPTGSMLGQLLCFKILLVS